MVTQANERVTATILTMRYVAGSGIGDPPANIVEQIIPNDPTMQISPAIPNPASLPFIFITPPATPPQDQYGGIPCAVSLEYPSAIYTAQRRDATPYSTQTGSGLQRLTLSGDIDTRAVIGGRRGGTPYQAWDDPLFPIKQWIDLQLKVRVEASTPWLGLSDSPAIDANAALPKPSNAAWNIERLNIDMDGIDTFGSPYLLRWRLLLTR